MTNDKFHSSLATRHLSLVTCHLISPGSPGFFMQSHPRIVFFGTPDFAVPSLERLADAGFPVVAVVTAPDRPSGRGLKMAISPVKACALARNIPVLQPVNMKEPAFLQELAGYVPDLQIVIAFRMMPRTVWSLPRLGTFNLHASLLPQYRGAAPIHRAVMNGESETGVTTFFLNDRIDEGKILLTEKTAIGPDETAGELHDRLMVIGAELVLRTVEGIISGGVSEVPQEEMIVSASDLKTAPKLFREDARIDWTRPVGELYNFIRGLSPHPGAYAPFTLADGTTADIRILRARAESAAHDLVPGGVVTDGKEVFKVAGKGGFIHPEVVQMPGRKAMSPADFLRGYARLFSETRDI
ncbi:MAG TPA: methionyl-tRNA formyltransferase [Bacteroidales bacterium]|nr:methionyl-tRNA formyltransferase [Bacteroidales bacterium]